MVARRDILAMIRAPRPGRTGLARLSAERRGTRPMLLASIADQIPVLLDAPGNVVLAYLDPGSGSMLLQLSIAGLLSGLFFLKSSYAQLRVSFDRLLKRG